MQQCRHLDYQLEGVQYLSGVAMMTDQKFAQHACGANSLKFRISQYLFFSSCWKHCTLICLAQLEPCYLNWDLVYNLLLISLNTNNRYGAYDYKVQRPFVFLGLQFNAVKTFTKIFMMFAYIFYSGVLVCENFLLIKLLYLNIIVFHIQYVTTA